MKILVAEDEREMSKIIKLYLEKEGHEVSVAFDGETALDMVCSDSFDLLLSDWMMPKLSGIELCREIRALKLPIKILLLTAKGHVSDEIMGLESGADDYLKKPFEPKLLHVKIRKLFKLEGKWTCGELTMDEENHRCFVQNKEMKLTPKEWQLMLYFIKNKGIMLSRNTLIEQVWGAEYEGDERTLDTHIKRLRIKIGYTYIKTYVGFGYRMDEPNE